MSDTRDTRFRDEQLQEAERQNLRGDNAVPEQRPIASQQFPEGLKSAFQVEKENDPRSDAHPMPKEAFDKAASDAQIRRAEKESQSPRLLIGETVRIVNRDDLYEGRTGVITDITFTPEGRRDALSGVKELHDFAEVEYYQVTTRDEGPHIVQCAPDEVKVIQRTELSRTVNLA